jgi:hypothetical protein
VYASASGTIVAARLGGDEATEQDPRFGSQRFVLVRHAVYLGREADPGGDTRVNYAQAPTYVFTLYMHLAAVGAVDAVNDANPPWFNYWRRRHADGDPNVVFAPEVEVAVGDWLGDCGTYAGRTMIHFEVMSRDELTVAPWDDARLRAVDDNDQDVLCDITTLDQYLVDQNGDGLDMNDLLRAAPQLRNVKSYHKSEWAYTGAAALDPLQLPQADRDEIWSRIQHFMWLADALSVCPDLTTQLCDATGFVWNYHPITFLAHVNRVVQEENGEVDEPDASNTNVVMEGDYLTRYVSFVGGNPADQPVDDARVIPYDISADFRYHLTRRHLACHVAGAHTSGIVPTATHFHIGLLDLIEEIRIRFNANLAVPLSHVCDAHCVEGNSGQCALGNMRALSAHANGRAADIRPSAATPAACAALWNAIVVAVAAGEAHHLAPGEPSRSHLPYGFRAFACADKAIQDKLQAAAPLTVPEAQRCVFHIELTTNDIEVLSVKPDVVQPTTGDSTYYSIPRAGAANVHARTFAVRFWMEADAVVTQVRAALCARPAGRGQPGSPLMTVLDSPAPIGLNGDTMTVPVTMTQQRPSQVNSTPPPSHIIYYEFTISVAHGDRASSSTMASKDCRALWRMPDGLQRCSTRDTGGDDWCSRGTYAWMADNWQLLAAVNDISGEHARDIGHQAHARGTDLDLYHFHRFQGAVTGADNYSALRDNLILAADTASPSHAAARQQVIQWVNATRNGIDSLAALPEVSELRHVLGVAGQGLQQGWARDLLRLGTATVNAVSVELQVGTWDNPRYIPDAGHDDHIHITLDRSRFDPAED